VSIPMFHLRGAGLALASACLAAAPARSGSDRGRGHHFADSTLAFDVPAGWRVEGAQGEYLLASEQQEMASLLLLSPDAGRSLEARLAAIEAQFLETGIIEPDGAETRIEDGEEVHYRRYRLVMGGAEAGSAIALHQYSFERAGLEVLLQVETPPESRVPEDLFSRIHRTLEVHRAPDPFVFEDPSAGD